LLLGILGVVLAAGCAGGEALAKDEYVSRLNAACEDFIEREQEIGEPQSLADLEAKGPRVLEAFEQTILDAARTLEAPEEIADQAARLAELAEEQRDVLAGLVEAAREGDVARVRELVSRNQAVNEEAGSIARDLGANACAGE
jgi:hypothetical protein